MSKAGIKPRWKIWEKTCATKAYEEKIQLKVIAAGLGRTRDAVNKKITKLGLRPVRSIPGCVKGHKRGKTLSNDVIKMKEICQAYAPLKFSQKAQLALKEIYWTLAQPLYLKRLKGGGYIGGIAQKNVPYTFTSSLEYILTEDHFPKREKKTKSFGDPFYVSLRHVEEWAASQGFQPVEKPLQQQGISYWKEGKYFSKAQVLIYINRIRFERKLQPLAIDEEEI